jgi:hypothetical protein
MLIFESVRMKLYGWNDCELLGVVETILQEIVRICGRNTEVKKTVLRRLVTPLIFGWR